MTDRLLSRERPFTEHPPSHQEDLARLLTTSQQIASAPDLRAGLECMAERLQELLPYDQLAVLLLDDVGRELRFALGVGYPAGVEEHWRFGLGQGIVGSVAQSGEPILAPRVEDDARYLRAADEVRSELAVPLRTRDRVIGVLDVSSRGPGSFTIDQQRLLQLVADCLASAIESRRLYQGLKDQARTLSVLHEVSRELTAILDRRRVLERVAERLKSLLDYDVFSVLLWNDAEQRLVPWVRVTSDESERSLRPLRLGEGISGSAAALRQLIRVPNVDLDPRYVACDSGIRVRSELAAPLVFEDRLIGVLDIESSRYDAFRLEHEQLLATLSSSLAIALANAELYESLREQQRSIDEDLKTARKLQEQLLPRSTPWVRGLQIAAANEPAHQLGGDFYDFLRYGEERIAVAVGDVAGKATSAALYATLATGILREFASHSQPEPARMLASLNAKLVELDVERRFVALTFAVYDARTRRLVISNAGLPYPLLLRGRRVVELELGGVPLGTLRQTDYGQLELGLEPGDAVVLSSDGISDALDAGALPFGAERVQRTLERLAGGTARDLADGLLRAVREFGAGAPASDDRTVVALRSCSPGCDCD